MLRTPGVLVAALAIVSCAGERTPPPVLLDPSNPDAPTSAAPASSTALSPESPQAEESAEQPPAAGGHEGHAQHGTGAGSAARPAPDAGTALYACPMHPEVTDTKPSRCPKCGMTLVPQKGKAPTKDAGTGHEGHEGHGSADGGR